MTMTDVSTVTGLPDEEFAPGSVTDTCGLCFGRFDLQRPAAQYRTVECGNGEWLLVCDTCAKAAPFLPDGTPNPAPALDPVAEQARKRTAELLEMADDENWLGI
jgi:hypothetical protein